MNVRNPPFPTDARTYIKDNIRLRAAQSCAEKPLMQAALNRSLLDWAKPMILLHLYRTNEFGSDVDDAALP